MPLDEKLYKNANFQNHLQFLNDMMIFCDENAFTNNSIFILLILHITVFLFMFIILDSSEVSRRCMRFLDIFGFSLGLVMFQTYNAFKQLSMASEDKILSAKYDTSYALVSASSCTFMLHKEKKNKWHKTFSID